MENPPPKPPDIDSNVVGHFPPTNPQPIAGLTPSKIGATPPQKSQPAETLNSELRSTAPLSTGRATSHPPVGAPPLGEQFTYSAQGLAPPSLGQKFPVANSGQKIPAAVPSLKRTTMAPPPTSAPTSGDLLTITNVVSGVSNDAPLISSSHGITCNRVPNHNSPSLQGDEPRLFHPVLHQAARGTMPDGACASGRERGQAPRPQGTATSTAGRTQAATHMPPTSFSVPLCRGGTRNF
ncbi:hypothetical protein Adt_40480 [Abeliophyllum distichum]|uniref:Uncharacterized protein n=1 Tax=Abeliophyllum distichum TaxID=126358 RepID=A0ABD1QBA9_9LAMI